MQVVDVRIFQTPKWFQYGLAVASVALATGVRYALEPAFGGSGPFVVFTFAVALAAFFGGLGPGIVATALSLTTAVLLFILPVTRPVVNDIVMARLTSANAMVWVFISIVCDLLRRTALGHQRTLTERDEHRNRLHTIIESMADGFFAVDRNWNITHANDAFASFAGVSAADLRGKSLWTVMANYNEWIHAPFEVARSGHTSVEVDFEAKDKGKWYHVRIFPDDYGMSGYLHDATYRKQIEDFNVRLLADEKAARTEAEQANKLKDEFIATLSHELRTPLTAILGWTELLRARPNIDQRTIEGLEAIERSTRLQKQLVDDLLDMSRISVGKVRLEFESLDLVEVLEESMASFRVSAKAKGLDVRLVLEESRAMVRGDRSRLVQIFNNLLSNAVKFTSSGGKVTVTLRRQDEWAEVSVADSGQGITGAFLPYLFDRFRQANATITRSHGGLGLGLSISKQLVDMHGGSIEAQSPGPDQGSTFVVRLQMAKSQAAGGTKVAPVDETVGNRSVRGISVLVVEDDQETRAFLQTVLTEAGADVLTADGAKKALVSYRDMRPMVIVSDIGMPEMDGYDFIRAVRTMDNIGANVPAIALSALARDEDRSRAFAAGFQSHISKPVDLALLFSTIHDLAVPPQSSSNGAVRP